LGIREIFQARTRADFGEALRSDPEHLAKLLAAAEARFFNIIGRNSDSILIVDAAGTVIFANPAAVELFGRDDRPPGGRPYRVFCKIWWRSSAMRATLMPESAA